MKKEKNKRAKIRGGNNIPSYNKETFNFVSEDLNSICENTMEFNKFTKRQRAEYGISTTECENGIPFDVGPSGGAASPNTEVNAENQGVISEIPKKPNYTPGK